MLVGAGLREFGVSPLVATAVVCLVALLDVRAARTTSTFVLAERVGSPFVFSLAALALAALACAFVAAPYVRVASATSHVEDVVHALAGIHWRSTLAASYLRRMRALAIPCLILAAAAATTPLDLSVAFGITILFVASSLASAATSVLLRNVADRAPARYLVAFSCASFAVLAVWIARATTWQLPLAIVPTLALVLAAILVAAAFVAPPATPRTSEREASTYGCRLPSLAGGFAPVALVVAETRARPLVLLPWVSLAIAAIFAMRWACANAESFAAIDRITIAAACLPAVCAAFDAGATTRHVAQPLWWLQAASIPAAVRGTVVATSITQFGLCGVIVVTALVCGASLGSAVASLVLGLCVTVIARCVATLARRRIRRAGIVGGSGLLELLEAASAAPFALLPIAPFLVFSDASWSPALTVLAAACAVTALHRLSRSVSTLGPGSA
jgi:hypothetical protein